MRSHYKSTNAACTFPCDRGHRTTLGTTQCHETAGYRFFSASVKGNEKGTLESRSFAISFAGLLSLDGFSWGIPMIGSLSPDLSTTSASSPLAERNATRSTVHSSGSLHSIYFTLSSS